MGASSSIALEEPDRTINPNKGLTFDQFAYIMLHFTTKREWYGVKIEQRCPGWDGKVNVGVVECGYERLKQLHTIFKIDKISICIDPEYKRAKYRIKYKHVTPNKWYQHTMTFKDETQRNLIKSINEQKRTVLDPMCQTKL